MKRPEGGGEADPLVSGQQSPSEHQQDQRDDGGLWEEAGENYAPLIIDGESGQLQVA